MMSLLDRPTGDSGQSQPPATTTYAAQQLGSYWLQLAILTLFVTYLLVNFSCVNCVCYVLSCVLSCMRCAGWKPHFNLGKTNV